MNAASNCSINIAYICPKREVVARSSIAWVDTRYLCFAELTMAALIIIFLLSCVYLLVFDRVGFRDWCVISNCGIFGLLTCVLFLFALKEE